MGAWDRQNPGVMKYSLDAVRMYVAISEVCKGYWVGRPIEKEMATHSSILAWETPMIEESGQLQPMGSQNQT